MMVLISFQLHEEVFIYTFPQEVYTLTIYCFHRRGPFPLSFSVSDPARGSLNPDSSPAFFLPLSSSPLNYFFVFFSPAFLSSAYPRSSMSYLHFPNRASLSFYHHYTLSAHITFQIPHIDRQVSI